MEIINQLKREGSMFKAVKAGKYELSIQGSAGHYYSPRELLKPALYVSMELAIFKGNEWVKIQKDPVFKKFTRYNELKDRVDNLNSSCTVFGYVPVNLINDLYLYLTK